MQDFFNTQVFMTVLVTLIVVLNPIPNVPVFLQLTSGFSKSDQRKTALKSVLYSTLIIVTFSLVGSYIMKFLGISLPAIMITGGVVLLIIAFQLLLGFQVGPARRKPTKSGKGEGESQIVKTKVDDVAVVPLAFPLVAGPGSIVTVITQAQNNGDHLGNWMGMFGAILCAMLLVLVFFLASESVAKFVSDGIMDFITKIFGMLLAAIAIGLCGDGIYEFIKSLIATGGVLH